MNQAADDREQFDHGRARIAAALRNDASAVRSMAALPQRIKRQMAQATAPAESTPEPKPSVLGTTSSEPGTAKVCVTNDEITFKTFRELSLPATTVFRDDGVLRGKKEEPPTWVDDYSIQQGAIVTVDPGVLTKTNRCVTVKVRMFVRYDSDSLFRAASEAHVFSIDDVVDYPMPHTKPPIEFGKLVDDISVNAVLLTEDGAPMVMEGESTDDAVASAKCLARAKDLAAHVHGGIGEQTTMVVPLGQPQSRAPIMPAR